MGYCSNLGEYRVFFWRSVRPRVSRMTNRQKMKPRNDQAEKYQMDPCTFSGLLIINSKEKEIMTKKMH